MRTESLRINPLGRQRGNFTNPRAVVTLLGMEGVVIVMTMQTCQRDCAANAKPGPESMQVVYADLAENPAQVYRRRIIAQSVLFGHLLEGGAGAKSALAVAPAGTRRRSWQNRVTTPEGSSCSGRKS